ncbi:MAG: hypothetical protein WA364_24295 [Candidatus Nitrosopolaris sp.]
MDRDLIIKAERIDDKFKRKNQRGLVVVLHVLSLYNLEMLIPLLEKEE